jgi:predicted oxidoreductase
MDEQLSIRIIRIAVDRGINFMDNCWDYNEGTSEIRMGKALRDGYRDRVFLMTKIDGRSKKEAARQIDQSLRRLQVDMIDLVQHHEVIRYEDPHRIFDDEGANAALVEAREAGKLRYIGFTGHKDPRIHLYMLQVAADHDFAQAQKKITVERIFYWKDSQESEIILNDGDLVFVTNGSMTAGSNLGSMTSAPVLNNKEVGGSWKLWEKLARENPEFGRPASFDDHVDESK